MITRRLSFTCGKRRGIRAGAVAALLLALVTIKPARAEPLDSSVLAMFPSNAAVCGYADLKTARGFPWFPQFQAQVVPVGLFGFEQFLEAAQMQQTPVIDQVAWVRIGSSQTADAKLSPGSGQLAGIALGSFDFDAIRSFLSARQISGIRVDDVTIYAAGTASGQSDILFALMSTGKIAFGTRAALQRLLNASSGAEENLVTNERMMNLVGQVNGDALLWNVFASGESMLLPDISAFPQARGLSGKLRGVSVAVQAPSDLEVEVQANAASPADAQLLTQLIQLGLMFRGQSSAKTNPDLTAVLAGTSVAANGAQVDISFEVNDDQMQSLIEHDSFRQLL